MYCKDHLFALLKFLLKQKLKTLFSHKFNFILFELYEWISYHEKQTKSNYFCGSFSTGAYIWNSLVLCIAVFLKIIVAFVLSRPFGNII